MNDVAKASHHIYRLKDFLAKGGVLMEFLHPILTEVLSRLRPTQFTQVIQWVERMSFILVNTPSAVEDEERHIFRNYVHTIPHAMSKKQTVIGFIFSIPLSLDHQLPMHTDCFS